MLSELESLVSFLQSHTSQPLEHLSVTLQDHYKGHWYPAEPERGSAFRALSAGHPALDFKLDLGTNWTIWVDPGCVSWKSEDSTLQEIYALSPPSRVATPAKELTSSNTISPMKRSSKAIQIIHPDNRKPSTASAPSLEVAPPTPVPMPMANMNAMPFPESPCRSTSPTSMASLIERPASRTSSIGSSSAASSLFSYKRPNAHHRSNSNVSLVSNATSVSSQSSVITRPASACSVTEHSNGKVGVLGGGVLLGVPSGAQSGSSSSEDSSENDEDLHASHSSATTQVQGKRRRSRHRGHHRATSSSGGSISRLQAQGSAQMFRQWNMQQQWAQNVFSSVNPPYAGESTAVF